MRDKLVNSTPSLDLSQCLPRQPTILELVLEDVGLILLCAVDRLACIVTADHRNAVETFKAVFSLVICMHWPITYGSAVIKGGLAANEHADI